MFNSKKMLILIIVLLSIVSTCVISFAGNNHEIINNETYEKIDDFRKEINTLTNIAIGFAAVTSVLIFIIHFIRLAFNAGQPMLRALVIRDIMITGVCTALIGGIGIIVKIYINIFA